MHKLFKHSPYWGFNVDEIMNRYYFDKCIGELSANTEAGTESNYPVLWFYKEEPEKPEHKKFVGFYVNPHDYKTTMVGLENFNPWVTGAICPVSKEILYSRYRHDFVCNEHGTAIDGGREYTKTSFPNNTRGTLVKLNLVTDFYYILGQQSTELYKEYLNSDTCLATPEHEDACNYVFFRMENTYMLVR